jgi:exonuclease III
MIFSSEICPSYLDKYVYLPSVGASGGSIVIWKSVFFQGNLVFQNSYALSVEFYSMHDNAHWILTNVYAPCSHPEKREFIQWFKNINMSDSIGWIIMGDFNVCRSPEDRNQPGGIMLKCICSTKQLAFLALLKFP